MALTNNPNRTRMIEKKWLREIRDKISSLKKSMLEIPLSSLTTNVTAEQQQQINQFMTAFREQAIGLFLSDDWQNVYQTQAYERGVERAISQAAATLSAKEAAGLSTLDISATALITTDIHKTELDFLHERANTKLDKWLQELLFDTRSILHEQMGIVAVDDIHAAIIERINVTQSRADLIAGTELGQASQRSVVKEVESINKQGKIQFETEWITTMDGRERPLHAQWHRKRMSNEQAARNMTISPWRCRCGLKVVRKDKKTPARLQARYDKERAIVIKKSNS